MTNRSCDPLEAMSRRLPGSWGWYTHWTCRIFAGVGELRVAVFSERFGGVEMDYLAIARDVSVIVASLAAFFGFNAWRREYVGKRRLDLAEEVYSLFHQARDAISTIRSPLGYSGEGSTRRRGENEAPEETQTLDLAYTTIERYKAYEELFGRLFSLQYRFAVQFGEKYSKPFNELGKVVNKLLNTAHHLAQLRLHGPGRNAAGEQFERWRKHLDEQESIIWDRGGEDDQIRLSISESIEEIGRLCQRVVDTRGWLLLSCAWLRKTLA